ncbi:MAG: UDP-3-O-acyl-N-acetylglucosamine deacetylase [Rhodospirillaceae bacterium]|nr:UDP-3-O-acyl-N-acetylglucosamine deacetylase [Rhodospirillaceae bacterium]
MKIDDLKQKTLKSTIGCSGVGLHSGDKISMTLHPADADSGIVFRRSDINGGGVEIKASFDNVRDTRLCTTIGDENGVLISTIEHLMAALAGAGVDNALVDVVGGEVPIMDGSAAPFMFLIDCAGLVEQDAPKRVVRVVKPVVVSDEGKSASLFPSNEFSIDFEIDFDSSAIQRQSMRVDMIDGVFKNELSRARTFGFMHEVEALRAAGFAKGGSLDNAVVVSGDEILNEDGLRFDDEFVRHKILDAVGDLYLAGGTIAGHFSGVCTGHSLNNKLLRALFADASNYEWINASDLAASTPVKADVKADNSASWDREAVAAIPATA